MMRRWAGVLAVGVWLGLNSAAVVGYGAEELVIKAWESPRDVTWGVGARKGVVDRIVVHCTAALETEGKRLNVENWFDTKTIVSIWTRSKVGPHYHIDRDGVVIKFLDEGSVAAHATTFNQRSIGVELAGLNDEKWVKEVVRVATAAWKPEDVVRLQSYTDKQYASLSLLVRDIRSRHPESKCIRHSDIVDSGTVEGTALSLYKEEGGTGDVVATLKKGTSIRVLALGASAGGSRWCLVRTVPARDDEAGVKGWCKTDQFAHHRRKGDPGEKFDRAKVVAAEWTDDRL